MGPVFKAKLWKAKAQGDKMKKDDWFERDMWIGKNGSLVYYSEKEARDLVYYTAEDIVKAKIHLLAEGESYFQWSFAVEIGPDIPAGEFATNTEEEMQMWMKELRKVQSGNH